MTRIESWITRLEANEPIDWPQEQLLLTLDMLRGGEQFANRLIQQDTQADDQFATPPGANHTPR